MPDWPITYGRSNAGISYPASGTYYIQVTGHATNANQKGSWYEIIASTPYPSFLSANLGFASGSADFLTDVGIGAEGSEVVLVNNIISSWLIGGCLVPRLFPIIIPPSSRIAFRTQATTAGRYYYSNATLFGTGGFGHGYGLSSCQTYGANTADSGGISIDPGSTIGAKGLWTEITSSLTYSINGFCIGIGNQVNTARTAYLWSVDIGIGANPNEIEIVYDFPLMAHSSIHYMSPEWSYFFPISLPAGTRISARASCSGNNATDRLFDIILYCFS